MKRDTVIQIQYSVFTSTLMGLIILLGALSIFGEINNVLEKSLVGGSAFLTLISFILVFYLAHLERVINWKESINLQKREDFIRKITYWIIGLAVTLILIFILTKLFRVNFSLDKRGYNFVIPFISVFSFHFPIDLLAALAGGLTGLALVEIWDRIRKPKLEYKFFKWKKVNFGYLLKIHFKLVGKQHPGICQLEIKWNDKSVFAKWDETANPIKEDNLEKDTEGDWVPEKFIPEAVPSTYYQPLFLKKEYSVPLLYSKQKDSQEFEIFSGWWFGRKEGYGPNIKVNKDTQMTLILSGSNFEWKETIKIDDILKMAKE